MFRRLLVANRGEIALRIIRAAQALGIETVAVYSEGDADSPHLAEATHTVCIGPAASARSYLNADALLQAARQTDCQALHPGFGFLSENARFAERCRQQQLTFVGPTPAMIDRMGDKASAKATMRAAGVPLIPGSTGNLRDVAEAKDVANRVGYPVILKATAGGGGRGMRVCRSAVEIDANFPQAALEAEKAFGNAALYLEKYIERSRHIEFQVLADAFGHVVHLGERECSVQRKHQKLIEEAPSPAVDEAKRDEVGGRIVAALQRIGYRNAGTVEMLYDPEADELYFMEMNTRLQVEHPVTEMVTGIDLVREQLHIAANRPLEITQQAISLQGHAIECRINAEDPAADFAPCPGTLARLRHPDDWTHFMPDRTAAEEVAVRLDTHAREGYTIPPYYDSMIGKLIVHSATRSLCVDRMALSLEQLEIAGDGVATTIPLHRRIMADERFRAGTYDTAFLPALLAAKT